ncbi:MAG: O-antigen ligase family protein [Anaerolineae bacterium]|nr:O-antigen ligase family protein [Anaerolineae bacterium]
MVLLGMSGITWLLTLDRSATLLALSRLFAGLSLMYCIINGCDDDSHFALFLCGGTLGAIALALVTPLLIPWRGVGDNVFTQTPHLVENPLNPNMLAGVLVMLLPFPLAGSILTPNPAGHSLRGWRWAGIFAFLITGIALVFTRSRGAWLAAGATVFVVCVGYSRFFLWVLCLPLLMGGWALWQNKLSLFLDMLGAGGSITGWAERVDIWTRTYSLIQDFPFTGAGANTYPLMINLFHPSLLISPARLIPHAHNLYLQIAVDLGIPGLIAFMAIVLLAFSGAIRCMRGPVHSFQQVAVWAACASLVAMLVHGLVDAATWIVGWSAPLPWMVIGLLMAAVRQSRESVAKQNDVFPDLSGANPGLR